MEGEEERIGWKLVSCSSSLAEVNSTAAITGELAFQQGESRASFRELPSDLTGALAHTQALLLHTHIENQPTTTQNKQIPNPASKPKSAELDEKLSKERKQLNEKVSSC